jgi:hypothetical protein
VGRPKELTEEERAELLAKGFRPVEFWVPDLDNPEMRERLEREARAVAEADEKDDIFEWLASLHALDRPDDIR